MLEGITASFTARFSRYLNDESDGSAINARWKLQLGDDCLYVFRLQASIRPNRPIFYCLPSSGTIYALMLWFIIFMTLYYPSGQGGRAQKSSSFNPVPSPTNLCFVCVHIHSKRLVRSWGRDRDKYKFTQDLSRHQISADYLRDFIASRILSLNEWGRL